MFNNLAVRTAILGNRPYQGDWVFIVILLGAALCFILGPVIRELLRELFR